MTPARQVYKAKIKPDLPYRVLEVSDIHMSNRLSYAKVIAEGVTDRLNDQKDLWRRIYKAATLAKVEAIHVLGDLFDESLVDAITLTETIAMIVQSPVPIYFLGGNHDAVNPTRGERFTLEALGEMGSDHVFYMRTGESLKPRKWLTFWPVEFCPVPETRQHISDIETGSGTNVLLLHNSVIDCVHIGWKCDHGLEASDVTEGFDYTISGHFHTPQEFGGTGRYLGAPMHHHFGDVGRDAGFWIMQFNEDGTREERFVDGGAPRFHMFEWDEVSNLGAVKQGDYVRIRLEMTHAELAKVKDEVDELVSVLKNQNIHAHWFHKPVYHHITRIKEAEGLDGLPTMAGMIDAYVEAVDVDTTGLDSKLLKEVGHEIFNTVAGTWQG